MRKSLALLIVIALVTLLIPAIMIAPGIAEAAETTARTDSELKVGNPTEMRGCFFTSLWGETTSDLDAQDLLHGYSPVKWDMDLVRFRYDHSVVQNAFAVDDEAGNRTYVLVFYDDLYYSDGTKINARDYAFSILLMIDPAIRETGGEPADLSWVAGYEEYMSGEARTLRGVSVPANDMLTVTVKAEALPYFYELSRLMIHPYPIAEIAPGLQVTDKGEGISLSGKLTAEMLQRTVLDPDHGYLAHPKVVSGPYTLESYDEETAVFRINRYYKGNEAGMKPRIERIQYTAAKNEDMIDRLKAGDFGLLNKVTMSDTIRSGIELRSSDTDYSLTNYARSGLTLIRFMESSAVAQDQAVRKAIAYCFDRDSFIQAYTGSFGLRADGYFGIGQWMYRLASGTMKVPEELEDAKISLDRLTRYEFNPEKAREILEEGGWTLNEQGEKYRRGVRYKRINGELVGLTMTMAMPESEKARQLMEEYLLPGLEECGFRLTIQPVDMATVRDVYDGKGTFDLLYLGENFSISFDPETLAPEGSPETGAAEATETMKPMEAGNLTAIKTELYDMAREMVRTDPYDVTGFMKKWVALQERITETLPILPVYNNVYFDFYNRELHDYYITEAVTWGEAIVRSYLSDKEILDESQQQQILDNQSELEREFLGIGE